MSAGKPLSTQVSATLVGSLDEALRVDSLRHEFSDSQIESDYRTHRHERDRRVVLFSALCVAAVILVYIPQDMRDLQGATLLFSLGVRALVCTICTAIAIAALRGFRQLHLLTATGVAAVSVELIALVLIYGISKSISITDHIMSWLVISITSMILMPTSFRVWILLIVLEFSGLFTCCWILVQETGDITVASSAISTVAAMISFAFVSRRQQLYEHTQYASLRIAQSLSSELARLANSDPLTGAANRRRFDSVAEHEMARALRRKTPLCLLALDIDRFKSINDQYGHPAGDAVLCTLVDVLKRSVREIDTVARLGGEEFALLLPDTTRECASQIAERIRSSCAATRVEFEDQQIGFTLSIGLAAVSDTLNDIEKLMQNADAALYEAKRNGRNRVVIAST